MAGKTFIYVGAEADGLYRKEAGDSRWEKLAKGMPPSPQARAIAVHPNDASTVFVGTQRGVSRVNHNCRFGVNQFCRFTCSAWPRCWAASVR